MEATGVSHYPSTLNQFPQATIHPTFCQRICRLATRICCLRVTAGPSLAVGAGAGAGTGHARAQAVMDTICFKDNSLYDETIGQSIEVQLRMLHRENRWVSAKEAYAGVKASYDTYCKDHLGIEWMRFDPINRRIYLSQPFETLLSLPKQNGITPLIQTGNGSREQTLFGWPAYVRPSYQAIKLTSPPKLRQLMEYAERICQPKEDLALIPHTLQASRWKDGKMSLKELTQHVAYLRLRGYFHGVCNGDIGRLQEELRTRSLPACITAPFNEKTFRGSINPIHHPETYVPVLDLLLDYCTKKNIKDVRMDMLDDLASYDESQFRQFRINFAKFLAHGIEAGKGGVLNLINLMFERELREEMWYGSIGDGSACMPDLLSGDHGPYFILLQEHETPTQHLAYVVQAETEKTTVLEFIQLGVKKGLIIDDEAQEMRRRLFTFNELGSLTPLPTTPKELASLITERAL